MASVWVSQPGTTCSSRTFLSLFSVLLLLLLQGPLHATGGPIPDGHGGVVDPSSLEQQDGGVDVQSLLQGLKQQFLRTFNLSGMGPPSAALGGAREEPPEYMMELYNRFANDRTSMPTANIIRSFKNEDWSPSDLGVDGVRRHPLLFNVSVPHHERVTAAELRLYTLVQNDRHLYAGVNRKVTVYEVELRDGDGDGDDDDATAARGDTFVAGGDRVELVGLSSRQVYGTDDGWEAFDLTAAVQRWRRSDRGTTHRLEVRIASLANGGGGGVRVVEEGKEGESPPDGDMKIDTSTEDKHKPLLIVFSDDQSADHRDDKRELKEMIDHETSNALQNEVGGAGAGGLWGGGPGAEREDGEPDEEDLIQMRSNLIYDTASRIRRNAKGNHCKKQSLYVEFKDIGWDSWIIVPSGYDAFVCSGVCSFPLTMHFTPTKHAIVQTLVNINSPKKVARACCVPTQLDPISVLYVDDMGVVTYKYKFEGMVVAKCGCR